MEKLSKLERFDNTLDGLESELEKLKDTSLVFKSLKNLIGTYGDIGEQQQNIIALLNDMAKDNVGHLEKLQKDNRSNYFELEKMMRVKLDENKSEIKRLIENERNKVTEIFVTELDKRFEKSYKNQKLTQNILMIIGAILIVMMIAILVILMN